MKSSLINKSQAGFCLFFVFIVLLLAGCSGLPRAPLPEPSEKIPAAVELDAVPFYPQDTYQCGPATLAMAMTWSGSVVTPDELQDQVYTPSRKGSLQLAMVSSARRHGKIAYQSNDPHAIFPELAAGHPVIILQNLGLSWLPVWHYAVVIGYDLSQQEVILRSGTTERKVLPYLLFEKTWSHSNYWGMLVLAPNQVPVTAKENDFLAAVVGLEKARHYQAAATGYQAALTRWPMSLDARMGLGNSYYALKNLAGAERSFRAATLSHPQSAAAYNNLAYVLLEQGRLQEALATAQIAVALGGPLKYESEDTLRQIRSRMR